MSGVRMRIRGGAGCCKLTLYLRKFSSKMMRSVSFVDRLELEFSGNHFAHALTIGDVDSDGVRFKRAY